MCKPENKNCYFNNDVGDVNNKCQVCGVGIKYLNFARQSFSKDHPGFNPAPHKHFLN